VNPLDLTAVPHPRFPMQGHILSSGGDALSPVARYAILFFSSAKDTNEDDISFFVFFLFLKLKRSGHLHLAANVTKELLTYLGIHLELLLLRLLRIFKRLLDLQD
jgi:hypothetical protein